MCPPPSAVFAVGATGAPTADGVLQFTAEAGDVVMIPIGWSYSVQVLHGGASTAYVCACVCCTCGVLRATIVLRFVDN